MSEDNNILRIVELEYKAGSFTLGPVSLNVKEGDYVALSGPSGSGKSMLLELIAGLRIANKGKIFLQGEDISFFSPSERSVGLLFQDYALFPHLSVFENIAYPLKNHSFAKPQIKDRVEELAGYFSLTPLMGRDTNSLSGGEKQRVALARAIAYKPKLLLLDEPLSALDEELRESSKEVLRQLKSSGQTILHVTHNKDEVEGLATAGISMYQGFIRSVF